MSSSAANPARASSSAAAGWKSRRQRCARRIGLDRSPRALVRDLSVAEQQMVEIARALSMKSRLIVMDEPTSALSHAEVQKLFSIIRAPQGGGHFHHLRDPPAGGGLRDLRPLHGAARRPPCRRGAVADTTMDGIIRLMVGRELGLLARARYVVCHARSGARRAKASRAGARAPMPAPSNFMTCPSRSTRARSSASPVSSARAAPRPRAPFSAPTASTPAGC